MQTTRKQVQAIADALASLKPDIDPAALEEPFDWLWEVVEEYKDRNVYQALSAIKLDNAEDRRLCAAIDAVMAAKPGERPGYTALSEINTPPVEWLWYGWVPRRALTLLAAVPGVGKTYFALDIARRVIHNQPAPDGKPFVDGVIRPTTNRVVWVDAEDFLPVIKSRVDAWGMDSRNFYPMPKPLRGLIDLSSRVYQDALIDMLDTLRPALVVIDSLSRVNRKGENSIEEMRDVLDFLAQLPGAFGCGLVLVHHLRKRNLRTMYRPVEMDDVRGTGDLLAASRSVLAIDRIPDSPMKGACRLNILKGNLAQEPEPLGLRLNPIESDPQYARLEYGEIGLYEAPRQPGKTEMCADWLLEVLANGPQGYRELLPEAAAIGFKVNVLLDARKKLDGRVSDTLGAGKPGNKWQLVS